MCPTVLAIHALSNEGLIEEFEAGTTPGPQREIPWKSGSTGGSTCTLAATSDIDKIGPRLRPHSSLGSA